MLCHLPWVTQRLRSVWKETALTSYQRAGIQFVHMNPRLRNWLQAVVDSSGLHVI